MINLRSLFVVAISCLACEGCYKSHSAPDMPTASPPAQAAPKPSTIAPGTIGEPNAIGTPVPIVNKPAVGPNPIQDPKAIEMPRPDAAATVAPLLDDAKCQERVTSDLPGASIHVTSKRCRFSLKEAISGVSTAYELRIAQPLFGVKPWTGVEPTATPWPNCAGGGIRCLNPRDESNVVIVGWVNSAENQDIGDCNPNSFGRCRTNTSPPKDVMAATFGGAYPWAAVYQIAGLDLEGGATEAVVLFTPGAYELHLRANGTYMPAGASAPSPFQIETVFPIEITP